MQGLKQQVFGDLGYTTDMRLSTSELNIFRQHINNHWLAIIDNIYPELTGEASACGVENYHQISSQKVHNKLWTKRNRVLSKNSVAEIKSLPFITQLKKEFGDFAISDIYDTEQHHGQEEIYWRIVRPNQATDVGSLHCDSWFHQGFNGGYGMFPDDVCTVKVWIPIYCEPGKNGLAVVAGSHLKDWSYHMETTNGVSRPILEEDSIKADEYLIPAAPGNLIIFNENILHGGVINRGDKTRVSVEITMVIPKIS